METDMTTRAEREYMSAAARIGCRICARIGYTDSPAELHHPRAGTGAGRRAPHSEVIPMCPFHHRSGDKAFHILGRKRWESQWLLTEAELTAETKQLVAELRALAVA